MDSQIVPQDLPQVASKSVQPAADAGHDGCDTNTTCRHMIPRRPATFLVLSPAASATYTASPPASEAKATPPAVEAGPNDKWLVSELTAPVVQSAAASEPVKPTPVIDESLKTRRSSSIGSDGSGQPRFLKLRPVHFGGEPGETDYA